MGLQRALTLTLTLTRTQLQPQPKPQALTPPLALPLPFTSWTWTELPHVFRVGSALPNMIMERHVVGCNPLQLRAAFDHLRALAHQQDREGHEGGGAAEPDPGVSALPPSPSSRATRRGSF